MAQGTQHFEFMQYLAIAAQWQQHSWWTQQYWPSKRNKSRILVGLGAGLGVLRQAELTVNEEQHSLEKDLL